MIASLELIDVPVNMLQGRHVKKHLLASGQWPATRGPSWLQMRCVAALSVWIRWPLLGCWPSGSGAGQCWARAAPPCWRTLLAGACSAHKSACACQLSSLLTPAWVPPQDLADFQRDKQARLNKVPAVVTMKAHAVQLPSGAAELPDDLSGEASNPTSQAHSTAAVEPGKAAKTAQCLHLCVAAWTPSDCCMALPPDCHALRMPLLAKHTAHPPADCKCHVGPTAGGIVMSRSAIERLQRRLGELASERTALKDSHRSLQRQATQLASDKTSKEIRLAELQARCKEVQLLKFGQLIDLSVLDQLGLRGGGNTDLKALVVQQVGDGPLAVTCPARPLAPFALQHGPQDGCMARGPAC